jgi:hypothetical protein
VTVIFVLGTLGVSGLRFNAPEKVPAMRAALRLVTLTLAVRVVYRASWVLSSSMVT